MKNDNKEKAADLKAINQNRVEVEEKNYEFDLLTEVLACFAGAN